MEMKLPTFFAFVHTRANGQHMFGYCLCLYEVRRSFLPFLLALSSLRA